MSPTSLQCSSHSPGSRGIRMAPGLRGGCTKLQLQGMLRGSRRGTTGGAPVPGSPTHCCFHRDGPWGAASPPTAISSHSVCSMQAGGSAGELNEQLKWQRLAVMIFPTDLTTPLLTSASEPKSLNYTAQSCHPTLPTQPLHFHSAPCTQRTHIPHSFPRSAPNMMRGAKKPPELRFGRMRGDVGSNPQLPFLSHSCRNSGMGPKTRHTCAHTLRAAHHLPSACCYH